MTNTNEIKLRNYKVSDSDMDVTLNIECLNHLIQIERPSVSIIKSVNDHTNAKITGIINQNTYERFALRVTSKMDIKITYHFESEDIFLFQGIIQQLEVDTQGLGENTVYDITIAASSYTYLMDIEKKSRSFQNSGMLYEDMFQLIASEYNQAVVLDHATSAQTLGSFTMQYKETDWEYLKRMGSRFYMPIIADHKFGAPRCSVGVIGNSDVVAIDDYEYRIVKATEEYLSNIQNYHADINEIDSIYYDIKTSGSDMESLQVGDAVWFQNKLFYILAVDAEIKDYILSHTYRLGGKQGFFCPPIFNTAIGGLSLQGTVMKAARNMLKIHLDIDMMQDENTAHWFQYATFYATWYCMPEIGDRVNVHFPTVEESEGIVLNSVRQVSPGRAARDVQQASPISESARETAAIAAMTVGNTGRAAGVSVNSAGTGGTTDAGGLPASDSTSQEPPAFDLEALSGDERVKMIATDSGKMLILDDRSGSVSIVCSDGTYITLSDSDGISIITDLDIKLKSDKDISIAAKETIAISAESSLKLSSGDSKIEINPDQILLYGTDIKLNS